MTSNLIQNYISNRPAVNQPVQQKQSVAIAPKKPMPDFDIQKELDNRTFIKPLEGKGRLLNGNIFNAPAIMVKDMIYDAKALKHAVSGKANDHELGKLNDFGLFLGGLAIASYLFTRKQTPMTKGMEFVGLASFLGAMAIWPKIAIQLPAYLIHGVNVQKQYEDSFGRKKPFYQDPQFLPWDLYTDKEIQKMGDRMGVPKDIPNRREFIQEKMKKIGIQNNTLWMLTAGFATPIMSGLICNTVEPYLNKYLDKRNNKATDKILNNLGEYSQKYKNISVEQDLIKILDSNINKSFSNELEEQITSTLTKYMDPVIAESLKKDLQEKVFGKKTYTLQDKNIKEILNNLHTVFKKVPGADEEFFKAVIPDEKGLIEALKNNNLFGSNITSVDFSTILDVIKKQIEENSINYNKTYPNKQKDLRFIRKLIMNNMTGERNSNPVKIVLSKTRSNVLNTAISDKLKSFVKLLDKFNMESFSLDEYALKKVGAAPETVIANYWNDVSKELMKTLGFTNEEITKARLDRSLMSSLLREKIEHLVSDKNKYTRVMDKLVKKIAEINDKIKTSDMTTSLLTKNNTGSYDNIVDGVFDGFANRIRKEDLGFDRTAKAIAGIDKNDIVGTAKQLQKTYVQDRLLGVKSSFYRIINTLDMYRRIASDVNSIPALNGKYTEVKEELIELCKIITLEGHSSDHATKFYMMRNIEPNRDKGPVEVKNGKVVNKYFGKTSELTDIPKDKYFYQDAMRFMYEGNMHSDTMEILKESSIKDEVLKYRDVVLNKLGGEKYFDKPYHLIRKANTTGSDIKFLLTGIAPDELIFKTGQQVYNNKKWLKIFGGFGAALLGVTVLAQFFFGKMKTPARTGEKK